MRKAHISLLAAGMVLVMGSSAVKAVYEPVSPEDRGQILNAELRTRVEYDDNVWTYRSEDEVDSFKVILQPRVKLNYPIETSHLAADYRFSYIWYDDREPDEEDLAHDLDVAASTEFSPRLQASISDTFRVAQDPELDPSNINRLRDEDFLYNSTNLGMKYQLTETLDVALNGRYLFYQYDEDNVAEALDRDTYVLGADLLKKINPTTTGVVSYRFQDTSYDTTMKDSTSNFLFAGVDHAFTSRLITSLRAGFENRSFDADYRGDDNAPYVDVSATYNLTSKTGVTGGYRLSLSETDIGNYLKSEHHGLYLQIQQEITRRINLYLAGQYDLNNYDNEDSVDGSGDGDETWWRLTARLAYKITEMVSAEAGYMFNDLNSDFDRSYDRNRIYLGLRVTY
jgi:hypothetical protein